MNQKDSRLAEIDKYKEKYVAFIDILGFRRMVKAGDGSPSYRINIYRALELVRNSLCEDDLNGMKLKHFSDCVVLSTFRNPCGLLEMLRSIETLTSNLLQYDVFVRGGLAVGGVHHDDDILFGVGVNRAYELESQFAKFPRTVVAEEVVSDAEEFSKRGRPESLYFITKGEDGLDLINYFNKYAAYDPSELSPGTVSLSYPARRIIDFVCNRLNTTSDVEVLEKVKWLQCYWNRTVAIKGVFKRIEAGVSERDHVGPTIICRRQIAKRS